VGEDMSLVQRYFHYARIKEKKDTESSTPCSFVFYTVFGKMGTCVEKGEWGREEEEGFI
jgi:hypothetical protein